MLSPVKQFWGNMKITLASSPDVNAYVSGRIKVAEYHAIYINFRKLVKKKEKISKLILSPYYPKFVYELSNKDKTPT